MDLTSTVDGLMGGLTADLARLAAIPSIAFPGYPRSEVVRAHDLLVEMLRGAGVEHIESLDLPDTAPVVYAEIPPPDPDAPTVLLYGHYDVQPPATSRCGSRRPSSRPRSRAGCGPAASPTTNPTSSPTWESCAPTAAGRPPG